MPRMLLWALPNVKKGRRYYLHFNDEEIEIYKETFSHEWPLGFKPKAADSTGNYSAVLHCLYLPGGLNSTFGHCVYCT